jgi:hypothetical protein
MAESIPMVFCDFVCKDRELCCFGARSWGLTLPCLRDNVARVISQLPAKGNKSQLVVVLTCHL